MEQIDKVLEIDTLGGIKMMQSISAYCNYTIGHGNGNFGLTLWSWFCTSCHLIAREMHLYAFICAKIWSWAFYFPTEPRGGDGCSRPLSASVEGWFWDCYAHWRVDIDWAAVRSCPLWRSHSQPLFFVVIVSTCWRLEAVRGWSGHPPGQNITSINTPSKWIMYHNVRRKEICKDIKAVCCG